MSDCRMLVFILCVTGWKRFLMEGGRHYYPSGLTMGRYQFQSHGLFKQ